jgi:hypothetical protein
MRHSVSRELYAYWNSLRGARAAPDRSDIDPAAIRHVLADSFIVEVEQACVFPIRLCGTRLNALWLSDQKGKSFLDLWRAEDRRNVAAALLTEPGRRLRMPITIWRSNCYCCRYGISAKPIRACSARSPPPTSHPGWAAQSPRSFNSSR